MDYQEFPKMLYRGDEYTIVADVAGEMAKRAEGFALYGEEPAAPAEPDAPLTESDDQGHTVASVQAQLDAAGIPYKKSFGLARLLTLLPS